MAMGRGWWGALLLLVSLANRGETQQAAAPLSFDTASVRPAASGAQPEGYEFMRPGQQFAPRGLIDMTAPLLVYIVFAYDVKELSEMSGTLDRMPAWTRTQLFTLEARPGGQPSVDQLREMMRTLLADRFALKLHQDEEQGPVERLELVRPGVLGPQIKPHPAGETCVKQAIGAMGSAPADGKPQALQCGVSFYRLPGSRLHLGLVNAPVDELAEMLGDAQRLAGYSTGGLASRPTIDATGLSGSYDLTLEFHTGTDETADLDETGGPTLLGALKEQLGMRLVKSTGPVRRLVIDHVAEPTPN